MDQQTRPGYLSVSLARLTTQVSMTFSNCQPQVGIQREQLRKYAKNAARFLFQNPSLWPQATFWGSLNRYLTRLGSGILWHSSQPLHDVAVEKAIGRQMQSQSMAMSAGGIRVVQKSFLSARCLLLTGGWHFHGHSKNTQTRRPPRKQGRQMQRRWRKSEPKIQSGESVSVRPRPWLRHRKHRRQSTGF